MNSDCEPDYYDYDDRYDDCYDDREDSDAPTGICSCCGKECTAVTIDEGIGPNEFWGSVTNHHDYHYASPCCEEEVVEGKCKFLETKIVTAKKRYKVKHFKHDAYIEIGEKYKKSTYRAYRTGGPSWIVVERLKIAQPVKPIKWSDLVKSTNKEKS